MYRIFLLLSLACLVGCETVIYRDNFDTYSNGIISVLPPGAPPGDSNEILPLINTDPNWTNIKVAGDFGPVLQPITNLSLSFWPYVVDNTNNKFRMGTATVSPSKTEKTFYWLGKKTRNDGTFICRFIGQYPLPNSSQTGTALAFELLFDGLDIIIRDITHIPNKIGTLVARPNGADAVLHSVYIVYNTQTGVASVTVKQAGGGGQGSEQITALERDQVASAKRWLVDCRQSIQGNPVIPTYIMDGVIMRER